MMVLRSVFVKKSVKKYSRHLLLPHSIPGGGLLVPALACIWTLLAHFKGRRSLIYTQKLKMNGSRMHIIDDVKCCH